MCGLPEHFANDVGTETNFWVRTDCALVEKMDALVFVEAIEERDWSEKTLWAPELAEEAVRADMIESRSTYRVTRSVEDCAFSHHTSLTFRSILLQVGPRLPHVHRHLTLGDFDDFILAVKKAEHGILAGRDQSKDLWDLLFGNVAGQRRFLCRLDEALGKPPH